MGLYGVEGEEVDFKSPPDPAFDRRLSCEYDFHMKNWIFTIKPTF